MSLPQETQELVREAVAAGVAPGAVALAGGAWGSGEASTYGTLSDAGDPARSDTRYDLASLTKVVATLPAVLRLAAAGELGLDDQVGRFFANAGWQQSPSLATATIRQLLAHSSGLPAWRPLFAQAPDRSTAIAAVLQSPLEEVRSYRYSDLGFILLGAIIEVAAEESLSTFVTREVLTPLGMHDTRFGPVSDVPVAPTERCGWRGRLLAGEVHDENAFVMGGVAGHAGLFGTAADLARYCHAWLDRDTRLGEERLLIESISEQSHGRDGTLRGLGWLLASPADFAGVGGGYGHTGFTGTSLWIDPGSGGYAVLLTNRVHPHRAARTGIAELRRGFHRTLAAQDRAQPASRGGL